MSDQGAVGGTCPDFIGSPPDAAAAKCVRAHRLPIVWITTELVVVACLILLVIILLAPISPSARFDSQIASAFEVIDVYGVSELRGERAIDGARHAGHDQWLTGLLSGGQTEQALSERVLCEPTLVAEYKVGRLQLKDHRLILTPGVDKQSAMGRRLIELLEQDNVACERASE